MKKPKKPRRAWVAFTKRGSMAMVHFSRRAIVKTYGDLFEIRPVEIREVKK